MYNVYYIIILYITLNVLNYHNVMFIRIESIRLHFQTIIIKCRTDKNYNLFLLFVFRKCLYMIKRELFNLISSMTDGKQYNL